MNIILSLIVNVIREVAESVDFRPVMPLSAVRWQHSAVLTPRTPTVY